MGRNPLLLGLTSLLLLIVTGAPTGAQTTFNIRRANLDGSNPQIVLNGVSDNTFIGVAVGAGKIYWSSFTAPDGILRRANLNGSNPETLVQGFINAVSIALNLPQGKMYWVDRRAIKRRIMRANLTGSNVETVLEDGTVEFGVALERIAVDAAGGKVYWTRGNLIRRSNLDGSNVETLLPTADEKRGMAVDAVGGRIYWAEFGVFPENVRISRANLDGSNIEKLVTAPLQCASGLALDPVGGKVYWGLNSPCSSSGIGGIQRANLDGSSIQNLLTGDVPISIALDSLGAQMYWSSTPWSCPLTLTLSDGRLYPDRQSAVASTARLHQVRDELLSSTAVGRRYTRLYYRHGPGMSALLARNPELRVRLKRTLSLVSPGLTLLLRGRGDQARVNAAMVAEVDGLLEALAEADQGGELTVAIRREQAALDLESLVGATFQTAWQRLNAPRRR